MSDTNPTISDQLAAEVASGEADFVRSPTVSAIPNPGNDVTSVARSVRAIKTVVDTLTGAAGSVLDKALTTRDLLNEGALIYSPAYGLSTSTPTFTTVTGGGGGGGGGGGYTDPRSVFTTPPTPTSLTASGAFKTVILTWNLTDYRNHAYTEVWRNTVDNLGTAALYDTVNTTIYADAGVTVGASYYYWVRAVNLEATAGAYNSSSGTLGAPLQIGTTDLSNLVVTAAKLADGSITASKLAAAAVGATAFAAGIEPVTIVSSVPGALSTRTVFNTTDGKLYRWNGSAYVVSVPAADVTGTLSDSQLAAISAAKVTGQITSTQIADGSISTPKLAAGSVTSNEIAANTITAADIAANTITGGNIASNTITGANILAGSVNADRLVANSITAGQIQAGAISTSELAAGAVTASKILVTAQGALNKSPSFEDTTAWQYPNSSSAINFGALSSPVTGQTGNYYIEAGSGTDRQAETIENIPLSPTKTYKLAANVYAATGNNRNVYVYIRMFTAAGTELNGGDTGWGGTFAGYVYGDTPTPNNQFIRVGLQFGAGTARPIPSNCAYCRVGVWFQYSGFGSSAVIQRAQDLRLEEAVDSSLIVDGTITATKLAANSIAVGTAAIQNGAITNAMIADLSADKITAGFLSAARIQGGTIDAGKLNITTLSAISTNIGTITAGTISGTTISGNTITGGTVSGTTITGTTISGNTISGGTVSGTTISGSTITGNTITGGSISGTTVTGTTITGGTIQTSASGPRIVLNESNNNFARFYGDGGGGTQLLAQIGNASAATSVAAGDFGSLTTGVSIIGVRGASYSNVGVTGTSLTGKGVYGSSNSDIGILGETASTTLPAVRGFNSSGVSGAIGVEGESSIGVGVKGTAATSGTGVLGTSSSGVGVQGNSTSSVGVVGRTSTMGLVGVQAANSANGAQLRLFPSGNTINPTSPQPGMFYVTSAGSLRYYNGTSWTTIVA